VPAARPAVFTLAVALLGAVPEAGLRLSQAALSLTVQLRVPPPVFVMESVLAAGFAPPCVPLKVRLDGLRLMVGDVDPEVTVKVTGTDALSPLFVVMVMVAV